MQTQAEMSSSNMTTASSSKRETIQLRTAETPVISSGMVTVSGSGMAA